MAMDIDVSTTDQLEIVARLLLAAGLGAFVGLERELRGYPAGIRTLSLVAVGAAMFTEISQVMLESDRIAAGIVSGIGFIGAGVIFREQHTVKGITTAASIWAVAAMGMAVGVEMYIVAIGTAVILFALLEARPFTRRLEEAIRPAENEMREAVMPDETKDDPAERRRREHPQRTDEDDEDYDGTED